MSRSARFIGLVLVLTAVLLSTNCASPEDAVLRAHETYRTALRAGDLEGLREILARDKVPELDSPRAGAVLEMMRSMTPPAPQVREVVVEGRAATVELEGELGGRIQEGTVTLVEENGAWKVQSESWEMSLMISGSGDWARRLRRGEQPRRSLGWRGHEGAVTALGFAGEGDLIVSIGYDDLMIKLWDRYTGALLDEVEQEHRPADMAVLPGGAAAAVVDASGSVKVWPVGHGGFGKPRTLSGDAGRSARVAVSGDGTMLATTCWEGPVQLWDLRTGEVAARLTGEDRMRGIVFSPRDNLLAAGHYTDKFTVWRFDDRWKGKKKDVRIPEVDEESDVWSVAISPDGKKLLTGHMDSSITLWNLEERKQIHDFYVQDASAMDVAFSPDGTLFATAQQNGSIFLWDVETSAGLARLAGHRGGAKTIAFSPAEWELLASGGEDGAIVIWE